MHVKDRVPLPALLLLAAVLVAGVAASSHKPRRAADIGDEWPTPLIECTPQDTSPDGLPMSRGRTDLDNDGCRESWTAEYSIGSGAGDIILTVHPSTGGQAIVFDWRFAHEDIVDVVPLPEAVGPSLLAGITRLYFGEEGYCGLDLRTGPLHPCNASFQWLVERSRGALRGKVLFDSVYSYTPIWTTEPPCPSPIEFTVVGAQTARGMFNLAWHPELLELPDDTRFLLIYSAYKHGDFHPGGRYGDWKLRATAWGVVVEDLENSRFSWAYVVHRADRLGRFFSRVYAPACVTDLSSDSGLVVIEQDIREDHSLELVIVDPIVGRWGVLPYWDEDWSIEAATHVLLVGDRTFRLSDLKRALSPR